MTCATCYGRGVYDAYVTTFSLNPGEHVRNIKLEDNGKQLLPCPDCAPRPFAEVKAWPGRRGWVALYFAGQQHRDAFDGHGREVQSMQEEAVRLNAAIEAREAKLRGAIAEVRRLMREEFEPPLNTLAGWAKFGAAMSEALKSIEDQDYVSGDIASGLAFDLGVMQAKFEGTWGVLADALLERGGESSELAWTLIGALGLKRKPHLYGIDLDGKAPRMDELHRSMTVNELDLEIQRQQEAMQPLLDRMAGMVARQPPPPIMINTADVDHELLRNLRPGPISVEPNAETMAEVMRLEALRLAWAPPRRCAHRDAEGRQCENRPAPLSNANLCWEHSQR